MTAGHLEQAVDGRWALHAEIAVALLDQQVDHGLEPEPLAVSRREDVTDAVALEGCDLRRHDDAAPTSVDVDIGAAHLPEAIHQVPEISMWPPW